MQINNEHILKDFWLMYKKPYRISDMRYSSPLVEKEMYDAFKPMIKGVAVLLADGRRYVSTNVDFDTNKKVFENMYYTESWKVFGPDGSKGK